MRGSGERPAVKGESVSEFLRHATEKRAEETLSARPSERFADVAGVVDDGGGRARRTEDAFAASLPKDHERQ